MDGATYVRAALLAGLFLSSACVRKTLVASTCTEKACADVPECSAAEQQLPETCDDDAGSCFDIEVQSDELACEACYDIIDRKNVESPVAKCGCTYCALQLTACFASAETEAGGGDAERDRLCQAMVECGWALGCAGSDCYCGKGVSRDTCLRDANEGRPLEGACAGVIQSAAKCPEGSAAGACTLGRQLMFDSAHYRATEVAKCVSGDPLLQGLVIEPKCR
jgi:hypothetical protein